MYNSLPQPSAHFPVRDSRPGRHRLRYAAVLRCPLSTTAICLLVSASVVFGRQPDESIDSFVAKKEKAIEASRQKLLVKVNQAQKKVRHSDLDADAKRLLIEKIAAERERFESTQELPSCDVLLEAVAAFANENQRTLKSIDDFRRKRTDKVLHDAPDDEISSRLGKLEEKVISLLGGRIELNAGSVWQGTRQAPQGAATLRLHVSEASGNVFRGELHQTYANRTTDIMKVEGKRDGHGIVIRTTHMLRGHNRSLEFNGCIL